MPDGHIRSDSFFFAGFNSGNLAVLTRIECLKTLLGSALFTHFTLVLLDFSESDQESAQENIEHNKYYKREDKQNYGTA